MLIQIRSKAGLEIIKKKGGRKGSGTKNYNNFNANSEALECILYRLGRTYKNANFKIIIYLLKNRFMCYLDTPHIYYIIIIKENKLRN